MEDIACDLDAIIYAWHSGDEAGNSIADILFGNVNPSGRTPITFPRFVGQLPLYYNVPSSGRPVDNYYNENPENVYADYLGTPYYPFGYGLSYTTFEYSDIKLDRNTISLGALKNGETIKVSVDVTNTGDMDGKETVQLYIHDMVAALTRPLRELKAFEKTLIKCGETKTFTFELDYKRLGYYNPKGEYVVEPGKIDIYVGENCLTNRMVTIEIK
jgi:beta-glucosidase